MSNTTARIAVVIMIIMLALAMAGVIDMGATADPDPSPTSTVPPTVWQNTTAILPAPSQVATASVPARRAESQIQVTEPPPPPFDPVAYVNSLDYCWQCPAPAMEAYRVVATFYGWADWQINGRAEFVQRIMAGESAFCWNAQRWTTHTALLMPCEQINPGGHDDAGFGQITAVLRPLTCSKVGICSAAATTVHAWNSMLAFVVVLDELGKRPWCYGRNTHVRNGDCATWPG